MDSPGPVPWASLTHRTGAKRREVVRERCLLFETLVTCLWYSGVAGDGLRSVGVEALPPSKGACSILPTVRHLRAGALGDTSPGPCFICYHLGRARHRGTTNKCLQ